jgi:REP element-mobilizing transposase RayT
MSRTGMRQRCWEHDYCAPSFYMITIVTEPRRNCLSGLDFRKCGGASVTESGRSPEGSLVRFRQHPSAAGVPALVPTPTSIAGVQLSLSAIGQVVLDVWQRTASVYSGVEACECVLMPDHFHGILWVKERLKRPVGHIVRAFKQVSTRECVKNGLLRGAVHGGSEARGASDTGSGRSPVGSLVRFRQHPSAAGVPPSLWQEGFQDSVLLHKGQLRAMVEYIADNPRRLATKQTRPELFTVVSQHLVDQDHRCSMVGNRDLLRHPLKRQVQISRRTTGDELQRKMEEFFYEAEHGAVLVSPCISAGEKKIARAVMVMKKPLIVVLENGFSPHYKPPGRLFQACAEGRLLLVAPFPFHRRRCRITREKCLQLNEWARVIAER